MRLMAAVLFTTQKGIILSWGNKMKQGKFKQTKLIERAKSLSGLISAVIVIGGALIAAGQWIVHEINLSVNARIDTMEQKMDDHQKDTELAITRLELMNLIQSDPTNKVEIEKLGRHYFYDLDGDTYMSGIYSHWCENYGGDASIVIK